MTSNAAIPPPSWSKLVNLTSAASQFFRHRNSATSVGSAGLGRNFGLTSSVATTPRPRPAVVRSSVVVRRWEAGVPFGDCAPALGYGWNLECSRRALCLRRAHVAEVESHVAGSDVGQSQAAALVGHMLKSVPVRKLNSSGRGMLGLLPLPPDTYDNFPGAAFAPMRPSSALAGFPVCPNGCWQIRQIDTPAQVYVAKA